MKGHAHGKIILIGEHSVVYGHPAIALPFKAGETRCRLETHSEDRITSPFYNGLLNDADETFAPIVLLIRTLRKALGIGPFNHVLESDIPVGAGLGSSAAIAAAIVRAYYASANVSLTDALLFKWVQYSEKNAHDNPSGIDALTVIHDHPWYFTKARKEPLDGRLDAFLVVADSQERTPTRDAVRHVASQQGTYRFNAAMEILSKRVIDSKAAYKDGDLLSLGKAMNQAMEALFSLGLSTKKLDALIKTAKMNGALAAKLSGGGMGGCMIALCENDVTARKVQNALEKNYGTRTWVTRI
ncbi:MAG: mevalonate kinase [Bacillota bacterium]